MTYKQVCRLCFLGIDDELKNDASSVYSTVINSSFYPVPAAVAVSAATEYEGQNMGSRLLHSLKKPTQSE